MSEATQLEEVRQEDPRGPGERGQRPDSANRLAGAGMRQTGLEDPSPYGGLMAELFRKLDEKSVRYCVLRKLRGAARTAL